MTVDKVKSPVLAPWLSWSKHLSCKQEVLGSKSQHDPLEPVSLLKFTSREIPKGQRMLFDKTSPTANPNFQCWKFKISQHFFLVL